MVEHGTAGTTRIEFAPDELFCNGGDYGEIVLSGTFQSAADAIRKITDRVRSSGRQPRISLVIDIDDTPPPVVEARHAGREGTPERGVGVDNAVESHAVGTEGVVETGAATGSVADHP